MGGRSVGRPVTMCVDDIVLVGRPIPSCPDIYGDDEEVILVVFQNL